MGMWRIILGIGGYIWFSFCVRFWLGFRFTGFIVFCGVRGFGLMALGFASGFGVVRFRILSRFHGLD